MGCPNRSVACVSRFVLSFHGNTNSRVYGARRAVGWWYTRKIDREVETKEILKTRLEEKIEELKEKSDYYNTQQLLKRFDSKSAPRPSLPDTLRESPPQQQRHPQHQSSSNDIRQNPTVDTLRQRGNSRSSLPPLPPPITPATFAVPPPVPAQQNIPQFHPSAFSPPPSPILPVQQQPKTFLDRVLDLLVGEDENAADRRYALICRHCRAHNGLAPPGERAEEVGYLCGRCGGWNGPEPNTQSHKTQTAKEQKAESNTEEEAVEQVVSVDKDSNEGSGASELVETQGKEE
jgi:endoplasmic reticulum junction formation protein lunapark